MPSPTITRPQVAGLGRRRVLSGPRTSLDAVAYLRVSTDEKTQLSIPAQRDIVNKLAAEMGYTIVKEFKDERSRGVRRDGLHALLDYIEHADVGAILFWQASRLWGHVEQQRRIMFRAELNGVKLIDAKKKVWKSDTPLDKLQNLISGGVNEFETDTTAERIYDTNKAKAADGQIITRPPYGVKVKRVSTNGEDITTEFVVDKEQMDVVRRIFRDFDHGIPVWKIAETLSNEGIKTQQGAKGWSSVNLRRLLDNKLYIGEIVWNRTKTIWEIDDVTGDKIKRVAYRPESELVTAVSPLGCILAENPQNAESIREARELFDRVSERRDSTGRQKRRRIYDNRVLDGLVICDKCGYRMQSRRYGNKTADGERTMRFDYRCQHRSNANAGCVKSHTMAENKIFSRLEALIDARVSGSQYVTYRVEQPSAAAARAAIERAERELEKSKDELKRLVSGYRKGDFAGMEDLYEEEKASALQSRADAEAALEDAQSRYSADVPVGPLTGRRREKLINLVDKLQSEWVPLDVRRGYANELFQEIRVNNPYVHVVFRERS